MPAAAVRGSYPKGGQNPVAGGIRAGISNKKLKPANRPLALNSTGNPMALGPYPTGNPGLGRITGPATVSNPGGAAATRISQRGNVEVPTGLPTAGPNGRPALPKPPTISAVNPEWDRQRSDISYRYNTDAAANAYGRFLSQQRGERQLGDMSRAFGRETPRYTASFGQRGLSGGGINSGAMHHSMRNYIGDYGRDYGRTQQAMTQELQQFDKQQADLDAWRQKSLADIQRAQAQETANIAAQLEYLRELAGGL